MIEGFFLWLIIIAFSLLVALTFHEAAHAWVAEKFGDSTAKLHGRISLNPIVHLDPIGTIFLLFCLISGFPGFGWAKPVPINPYNLRNPKQDMMWISLAGPGINFCLALCFGSLIRITSQDINQPNPLFASCFLVNLMLAAFNLIPIPPLDGSKILFGLLPETTMDKYRRMEPFGLVVLLLLIWTNMLNTYFDIFLRFASILCGVETTALLYAVIRP